MAPFDKTSGLRGAHGLTITELLAQTRRLYGGLRMADETAEEKATREAAEAKAAADAKDDGKGGKGAQGGDPTEAELAALGDAGKRALERIRTERDQLRTQAETAAEKARKYDELEEANKTEQQKRDDAAAETAKRAETAETKLAKLEAALAAGLPHTAAPRLVGTTPAELKKDAEAYAAELAANGKPVRRTTSDADAKGTGPDGGMSSVIRRAAGRQA